MKVAKHAGDALGDRMKDFESHETARRFLPGLPVYARIDGRGFSKFTKGMERPFDARMSAAMIQTTKDLVENTHARIGYTQSDEISLVWQAESYDSGIFFNGKVQKMCSNLASEATMAFVLALLQVGMGDLLGRRPKFDCRVFQLPSQVEAANMFLWRNQDATKNAISMAARHHYPHKALDRKNGSEMQEMLFAKDVNFNNYPPGFKRGTWVRRATVERSFTAEEIERIPEKKRPPADAMVTRTVIRAFYLPRFGSVLNREAVVFDGAEAMVA